MNRIEQDIITIKELLKQKPEQSFKLNWIESKNVPPLLGISNRTWQSWRSKRIIPFSQFGSKIFVKLEDLNKLLESHMIETSKTA
ncbi:MAG: helix-turn-helix domain-containing protein [Bacteroidetes bacterium]|nr:helix-turn-helix domain-containing protein [Bacteroidota bacterium]